MISISKPLSAGKISTYFRSEYSSASSHYYAESETLRGEWHGKLAETFQLDGQQVNGQMFDRLALGQHPHTGEQLIRHRDTIKTASGEEVGHRAGWDMTFSPGKSVSLAALVGGDTRIVEAHRNAVRAALVEAENLVQARIGGNNPPQTTGKFLVAAFEHDTSRPVDGYAAAQLHTHAVVFNMTEDRNGQARSLQTHEFYVAAPMITAVYQNALETQLRTLGYTIERGKNHAPEIYGFTPEYLASESLRSQQITEQVESKGLVGAESREIAAHSTRDDKLKLSAEQVREMHAAHAAEFGNQPARVVQHASLTLVKETTAARREGYARKAIEFARVKLSERNSVFDHHEVLTQALRHSRGRCGLEEIKTALETAREKGELIEVNHVRTNAPLHRYTTAEMLANERYAIEKVRDGKYMSYPINVSPRAELNEDQSRVMLEVSLSRHQIMGIQGKAGTGKTTVLRHINDAFHEHLYQTIGLAPTSKATAGLKEAGIDSQTLQRYLTRDQEPTDRPRVFFLDESSLASGQHMRQFLEHLGPKDRAILVGDTEQHESVEAGRIFGELQESGMQTFQLSKIVRQQDAGLLKVVEALAVGDVKTGLDLMGRQGRIESITDRSERFEAIAKDYASQPDGCLVVCPDNMSRRELNEAIRKELRASGMLENYQYEMRILVNRQDVTGADRAIASSYQPGDIVRYRKDKSYATVLSADSESNTVIVRKEDGSLHKYDPSRKLGVSIYEQKTRSVSKGERIQFTSPDRKLGVSNRDTGTVTQIDERGNVRIRLDSGRTVGFNLRQNAHVDHGYCTTSHASQGVTADRVIMHIDTGDTRIRNLVNDTLNYVGISRARYGAKIYTDDESRLENAVKRHQSNSTALNHDQIMEYAV